MYDNPDYDPADDEIDVLKDPVSVWMKKLRNRAYRGANPEGGYECAPAVAVGQVQEEYADFSICVDDDNEESVLSADNRLEPANRFQEPVPKESDEPIFFPAEDFFPAGFFGAAVRNFAKAATLAIAVGVDPSPIEEGWKKCWGIQPDVDMSVFYGRPRSVGEAAWAGISRKSTPVLFAMRQSQQQVGVVDHGKNRKDMGPHKLVDWPRVKTVCMAHAVELYADDHVARNRGGNINLHYKLNRAEVPDAPSALRLPEVKWADVAVNPRVNVAIIDTISKIRNAARVRGAHTDRLDASSVDRDGVQSLFQKVIASDVPVMPAAGFEDYIEEDTYNDFAMGTPINLSARRVFESIRVSQVMESFARSAAEVKQGAVPRAKLLRDYAARLGSDIQQVQARDLCVSVFPGDVLVRLYHLGQAVSDRQGVIWVKHIVEAMGGVMPNLTDEGLVAAWDKLLTTQKGARKALHWAATGIAKHEVLRRDFAGVNSFIAKKLQHPVSILEGFSDIIHQHSIYWSNRYIRYGDRVPDEKVMRQIRAKVLRKVRLVLDQVGTIGYDHVSVATVLTDVAISRVSSLGNFGIRVDDVPQFMRQPLERYSLLLDNWVSSKIGRHDDISFVYLHGLISKDLTDFVADFQGLVRRVIAGKSLEVGAEWFDPDQVAVPQSERKGYDDPLPNMMPPPLEEKEEKKVVSAFGAFDFDVPEQRVVDQTVDLSQELAEKGIDVMSPLAIRFLNQHPPRVHWNQVDVLYNAIVAFFASEAQH